MSQPAELLNADLRLSVPAGERYDRKRSAIRNRADFAHLLYDVKFFKMADASAPATALFEGDLMKSSRKNVVMAVGLVAIGLALAAAGIYIGDTDDAPGAALIGIVLMIGAMALAAKTALRKT